MKTSTGKKHILIVDDDAKMRKVVAEFFKKNRDVRIIQAKNGIDAIAQTCLYDIDAVLTDLEMPEMTGLELLGYFKTRPELKNIPVVFLTSQSDDFHKNKAKKLGAHAYLKKPFNSSQLTKVLSEILNRRKK